LAQAEVQKRQTAMDSLLSDVRMREQARADMAMQRAAERDRINDERYEQERKDRLMTQADARATQYQTSELARQEREDVSRQGNL
jgi:hypothetical protein